MVSQACRLATALVLLAARLAVADDVSQTARGYEVSGAGTFNYLFQVDFSTTSALPKDLQIDTGLIGPGNDKYSHTFTKDNVKFNAGDSLSLLVPGQPSFDSDIPSAEIATTYGDILYGSVRTVAKASKAKGTCHGFFFYHDDTQETDIELLTKDLSKTWFTNQDTGGPDHDTYKTVASPATISDAYHEYRLDWLADRTDFYIDGTKVATINKNVPSVPGPWIWNNWASGGVWTGAPPTETSDLRIKSITAYLNRTSVKYQPNAAVSSAKLLTSAAAAVPSTLQTSVTSKVPSGSPSTTSAAAKVPTTPATSACSKGVVTVHKTATKVVTASTAKKTTAKAKTTKKVVKPAPTKAQKKATTTKRRVAKKSPAPI